MYKIIGANQVEYGPITAEQLRQWIAEGRVNAQTLAQAAGETTWRPVSSFPEFAASFPAGAPPSMAPGFAPAAGDNGRALALQEVSGPGIGLIITGALGILSAVYGIMSNLLMGGAAMREQFKAFPMNGQNHIFLKYITFVTGPFAIFWNIGLIAVCIFIIMSGVKMRRLESFGFCMTGTIIAMLPCCSPCCCIGIPIGIWALVMLNKPEVRANFN